MCAVLNLALLLLRPIETSTANGPTDNKFFVFFPRAVY
jgi:hypothetical protein